MKNNTLMYEHKLNTLIDKFKMYYPEYKTEKRVNNLTEITTNFINTERNLNELFKNMIVDEDNIEQKIDHINKTIHSYDTKISTIKRELRTQKNILKSLLQHNSASKEFKKQYDVAKDNVNKNYYYELFGIFSIIFLIYKFTNITITNNTH